jgi:hypothetical protein
MSSMAIPYALGQRVRFNKRCVLAANVPKHSQGYKLTALVSEEGDAYQGEGVIELGTLAVIVDYAAHGTGTSTNPVVRVGGRLVRVHPKHLDPV